MTSNIELVVFRITEAKRQNLSKDGRLEGRNINCVGVLYMEHDSCTSVGGKKEKGNFYNKVFPLNIEPPAKHMYLFLLKGFTPLRSKKMS